MKQPILTATLTLLPLMIIVAQQQETFDVISYTPPGGWKKEVTNFAVSYIVTNDATGSWCRVALYKSVAGSGNYSEDFVSEWNALVTSMYQNAALPTPEAKEDDGWTTTSGVATAQWQEKDAHLLLKTFSGYGIKVSVLVSMNTMEYQDEADRFVKSIGLKKPETGSGITATTASQPATIVSDAPGNNGISISTTNFDDGWVAQPFADYIRITKQQTIVLLHYGIAITDELRRADNMELILWDRLITPRYRFGELRQYDNGSSGLRIYFYETDATEIATGRKYHLGLRIIHISGVSHCIEILSTSRADFQKMFPDQETIEALLNYNKFGVALADLAGAWTESTSNSLQLYNTITGGYAGASATASATSFTFAKDGAYESTHKGVYGTTINMNSYDQKYKGMWSLTPWEITLTNRWQGKTEHYLCQYEATRGGRILHLTDKSAPGVQYHLKKAK